MLLVDLARGWLDVPSRHKQLSIAGIASDSRRVREGDLFVAIDGPAADGHRFITAAARAGAVAAIGQRRSSGGATAACPRLPYFRVPDSRWALGRLCAAFYGHPSRDVRVIGITGTKGKTTTSWILDSLLRSCGGSSALIGTVENRTSRGVTSAKNTTPGCIDLHALLREHRAGGGTHAVVEVSSHAIEQRRIAGLEFAGGIFTNVAPEHLDYHRTFENYLEVKKAFFAALEPQAFAVLSREDRASQTIARETRAEIVWYSGEPCDGVEDVRLSPRGMSFRWRGRPTRSRLVGYHNLLNALAALTAAASLGIEAGEAVEALAEAEPPPGRLEDVSEGMPFRVIVDYAHTDGSLDAVLKALRPVTPGRLITIFGCGGDRDRSKRPRMGRVAESSSDQLIVTSDNPRTECADRIIGDILRGLERPQEAVVVEDRREAIALGIRMAREGDTVLIAGKGHETYQEFGSHTIHFDDREVAREFLRDAVPGAIC